MPQQQQTQFLSSLTETEADTLNHDWPFWARPSQILPPGDWQVWLILAGRGFGKTRTGAETVREWVKSFSFVNLIGATADDARDIMIEGESGILSVCPSAERPVYRKSERKLLWPNGATSLVFTADEPERLRGKQHQKLWGDELAAWRYPEAWDQAMFGLRLGKNPQAVVTTTPRPVRLVRELLASKTTVITRGSSYENKDNLAPAFLSRIVAKYEGTRLGRQELNAELLEDNPGALWQRSQIDSLRVVSAPALSRVVVAVDPSAGDGESGAEAGIIVAALGQDGQGYVLADQTVRGTPETWAREAVTAYHKFHADRLVAETNNGGKMIEALVRVVDKNVAYKEVHASRGKEVRAEPVSALYEQAKVHHVGTFPLLEDQMVEWVPGDTSPDRLDALVWAMTELMLGYGPQGFPEVGGSREVLTQWNTVLAPALDPYAGPFADPYAAPGAYPSGPRTR